MMRGQRIDKKLQCKTSYSHEQLWHLKRDVKQIPAEKKQELLLEIQARAQLAGEPVKNQEAYNLAMRLLKGE